MAQVYRFTDENGQVRLMAEIDPAPGGGYTPPTTRAQYNSAAALSVANNSQAELPWNTLLVGTALLDITAPTEPLVVVAGIYTVSVEARPADVMTATGWWQLALDLDATGQDAQVVVDSAPASAAHTTPQLCASLTYYVPAGGMITVAAANHDGVQAIHFSLQASIQRVT